MSKVIIRADGSGRIGFGHKVRSQALADMLPDAELHSWEGEKEADEEFLRILDADPGAIAVLDNYFHTPQYMEAVRSRSRALVCIDDMPTRHFPADALISFCPFGREEFSLPSEARFLSGFQYSLLRAPFLRPQSTRPREGIAVVLGGADPLGLTSRTIRRIHELLPEARIEAVAGAAVKLDSGLDAIPRLVVHRRLGGEEMADLFDRCSLGIFPASTVCMEALARHLPVAAGHFVDNQLRVYEEGVRSGLFLPLGDLREFGNGPGAQALAEAFRSGWRPSVPFPDFQSSRREIFALFEDLDRN